MLVPVLLVKVGKLRQAGTSASEADARFLLHHNWQEKRAFPASLLGLSQIQAAYSGINTEDVPQQGS